MALIGQSRPGIRVWPGQGHHWRWRMGCVHFFCLLQDRNYYWRLQLPSQTCLLGICLYSDKQVIEPLLVFQFVLGYLQPRTKMLSIWCLHVLIRTSDRDKFRAGGGGEGWQNRSIQKLELDVTRFPWKNRKREIHPPPLPKKQITLPWEGDN